MAYGYGHNADRFSNYRTITAKYASVGACGHPIKAGDEVGYHAGLKICRCSGCWQRWVAENAEAQMYEDRYCSSQDGY